MAKPGAMLPSLGAEVVISAAQVNIPPGHGAFRIAVTTAGTINAIYKRSNTVCHLYYPAAGVYFEPGEFKAVWLGAAPPVTSPANTIILLNS